MKVLVIGAGISGLGTAQALSSDGHEITVIEKRKALRTAGAALTLWSNGTGFLAELGVSLDGVGAPIDCMQQRGSGRRAFAADRCLQGRRQIRTPAHHPARRRPLERLFDGLPGEMISFGKACTRVGQRDDQISVEFADGTSAYGDLLIGADGRHSAVRDHLWARIPPDQAAGRPGSGG